MPSRFVLPADHGRGLSTSDGGTPPRGANATRTGGWTRVIPRYGVESEKLERYDDEGPGIWMMWRAHALFLK